MRKLALVLLLVCTGCGDMQFFVKDELKSIRPSKILIGEFSSRDMSYDPFLADQFRESLRFVFFRNGYNVQVAARESGEKKGYDNPADAAALCAGASADMLIHGVISRKEAGTFADRTVFYAVSFIIRDKSGNIRGEGNYSDTNVNEPVFIKDASESFVSEFSKQVSGR